MVCTIHINVESFFRILCEMTYFLVDYRR